MQDTAPYAAQLVREQLDAGPHEGEDFFRAKFTGAGETKWFNVTPGQLAEIAAILEAPTPVVPTIDSAGITHCGSCDGTAFSFEESHPCTRSMASNAGRGITFHGDFEWFDGDDTPGVQCSDCGAIMDAPHAHGVEIDYC